MIDPVPINIAGGFDGTAAANHKQNIENEFREQYRERIIFDSPAVHYDYYDGNISFYGVAARLKDNITFTCDKIGSNIATPKYFVPDRRDQRYDIFS